MNRLVCAAAQAALAATLALTDAGIAAAEEEKKLGWFDTAEFSYVAVTGNSETSTLGFKNLLTREWEEARFRLRAGGIRADSTTTLRFAVGPDPENAVVTEIDADETTAENYYFGGRYDRNITDRLFWFTGVGWERNRFAGIDNRYVAEGGVGHIWHDRETLKFRTDYALTYTKQEDVFEVPGADDTFFGARFSWDYLHKFGTNTTYQNLFIADLNLEETSDWRGDMVNSLAVAMSKRLALKVSLQWLYDNEPAFDSVPLFDLDPSDPGATQIGTLAFGLDELDTVFAVSLVVNF